MARMTSDELQTRREIRRAEALVSSVRGLDTDRGAAALRHRATAEGVSLHAAALAVLATEPTDRLLVARESPASSRDEHDRGGRHRRTE
jgi:hypothetical protein